MSKDTHNTVLTDEQKAEIRNEMLPAMDPRIRVVRFLVDGCNLQIGTGYLSPRGVNVLHQTCYWNFSEETSRKIAEWLGAKAVFSD